MSLSRTKLECDNIQTDRKNLLDPFLVYKLIYFLLATLQKFTYYESKTPKSQVSPPDKCPFNGLLRNNFFF